MATATHPIRRVKKKSEAFNRLAILTMGTCLKKVYFDIIVLDAIHENSDINMEIKFIVNPQQQNC